MKALLDGITCKDLEDLVNRNCFKPKIFASYIKMINQLNEVKLDCAKMLETSYQEGENVPTWAKDCTHTDNGETSGQAKWNNVVVLDPPSLVSFNVSRHELE